MGFFHSFFRQGSFFSISGGEREKVNAQQDVVHCIGI